MKRLCVLGALALTCALAVASVASSRGSRIVPPPAVCVFWEPDYMPWIGGSDGIKISPTGIKRVPAREFGGSYYVGGSAPASGYRAVTAISFSWLASCSRTRLITIVFVAAGMPTPPTCTTDNQKGSASSPRAAPGYLCIYEGKSENTDGHPEFIDPTSGATTLTASPWGVGLRITSRIISNSKQADQPHFFYMSGTWAVQPPRPVASAAKKK